MAFNRRKLHPGATPSDDVWICERYCGEALGEGEDCSSLCLKKCPSLCSDTSIRPLPSPPLLAPFAQNKHGRHINLSVIIIIIIIAVLVSLLLLVSCYKIVVKILSNQNTSRRTPPAESDDTDDDFLDDNQDPLANNPVWFINSVGLQRSIINSITVCKYKRGEGLIEGTDCSVCLSEFREDETLRLLPKCSHAFHIPCIDTWLRSHKNCPLCRAPIVSYTDERFLAPSEPNFNGSSSREETQMETFEIGNGGLISDHREENGFNNPRTGDDNEGENPRTDAEISKVNLPSSFVNCRNRVLSDLDDNYRVLEDEIQPFRRSVSMNSSLPSMMSRCV